jgi:hypothetical protein
MKQKPIDSEHENRGRRDRSPLEVHVGGGPVLRMRERKLMSALRNISETSASLMLIGSPPTKSVVFSTAIFVYPLEFYRRIGLME